MFENVFKLLKIKKKKMLYIFDTRGGGVHKSLSRIEPKLGMEPKNRQNRSINEDRSPPPPPIKCNISSVLFYFYLYASYGLWVIFICYRTKTKCISYKKCIVHF